MEVKERFNKMVEWSLSDKEKNVAIISIADGEERHIHYHGNRNDIGKAILAVANEDEEVGLGIYIAAVIWALNNLTDDQIDSLTDIAKQVAGIRQALDKGFDNG